MKKSKRKDSFFSVLCFHRSQNGPIYACEIVEIGSYSHHEAWSLPMLFNKRNCKSVENGLINDDIWFCISCHRWRTVSIDLNGLGHESLWKRFLKKCDVSASKMFWKIYFSNSLLELKSPLRTQFSINVLN